MIIKISECCGTFAENKDLARDIREKDIRPKYDDSDEKIILDFAGVDSSTQSFIHALISHFFQTTGESSLDRFEFKGCNKAIKSLITTVINYSLE
ncbi:MAG: DUF4325 domain-containing protein [Syntrophobacteraceae bacterium]|jgi:hypothetical protein